MHNRVVLVEDDIAHTRKMAERVTPEPWQFRHVGRAQGITQTNDEGETTTLLVDDAPLGIINT